MSSFLSKAWRAALRLEPWRANPTVDTQAQERDRAPPSLIAGMEALGRGELDLALAISRALHTSGPEDHAAFLRACCAERAGDEALRLTELRLAHCLVPEEPAYAIELAKAVAGGGLFDEAILLLGQVIEQSDHKSARDPFLHYFLACWRDKVGATDAARASLERALALKPGFTQAAIMLAESFSELGGEAERALTTLRVAAAAADEPGLLLRGAMRLPDAYRSTVEIADVRGRFRRDLEALLDRPQLTLERPERSVGRTAFMLAFHGLPDRHDLELLGRVVRRGYHAARSISASPKSHGRLRKRVGFVSGFYWLHSVGRAMLPLFEGLDRTRFEVRAYTVAGQKEDALTSRIRQSVDAFITLPDDVASTAGVLAREELDLLIYPDIGMHPFTYFLAFWRLAPIQCVCAGHPDTTGIDSIDYYLSDGNAEPPDAEKQYSERLIRIPDFYLPLFELPEGEGAAAAGRANTYVCSQSIIKLHPDFDPLLAGILAQDRRAEIVLFGDAGGSAGDVVAHRLKSRLGPLAGRLRMIPRQLYEGYLDTIRDAAVMLDTPHFGGGHTTLEALSMHVPVVTRRGEFLRGRFAATRLSSLGLNECIAEDAAAYVDIAVEIANSPQRRARVVDVLRDRSATLLAPARPAASFNAALVRLLSGGDHA